MESNKSKDARPQFKKSAPKSAKFVFLAKNLKMANALTSFQVVLKQSDSNKTKPFAKHALKTIFKETMVVCYR